MISRDVEKVIVYVHLQNFLKLFMSSEKNKSRIYDTKIEKK